MSTTAELLQELSENSGKLQTLNNRLEGILGSGGTGNRRALDYDLFWNTFQDFGNRAYYNYAFANHSFSKDTFYPKYNISFGGSTATMCFNNFFGRVNYDPSLLFNLKQRLDECGVTFTTADATTVTRIFSFSYYFTEVPSVDLSGVEGTSVATIYYFCHYLETAGTLKVKETITVYDQCFSECFHLKNIVIEGTIAGDGIDLSWSSVLTKASIESFINALSTATSGKTITFSLDAVNKAYETSTGANDGSTSAEWSAKKATRNNWIILASLPPEGE